MSDTPRTDSEAADLPFPWERAIEMLVRHAEQLERELNAMTLRSQAADRTANAALAAAPEERTQEAMKLLQEAHMFANAQAFVADDYDAHCDRLAKFLGYTVDTHGPIKEKE